MGLQISEDIGFQRRQWAVERTGAFVLAGTLVGAVLGLFGPGLLGPRTAESPGGALRVEYPAFARQAAPAVLRVRLRPRGLVRDGRVRLRLAASYLAEMALDRVTPTPARVELGEEYLTLAFDVDPDAREVQAWLDVEARRPGVVEGSIGLDGDEPVLFRHVVYP